MKLLILTESFSTDDVKEGKPFSGGMGSMFRGILEQTGIDEDMAHLGAIFPFKPGGNTPLLTRSREDGFVAYGPAAPALYIRAEHERYVRNMWRLIRNEKPNCILALGDIPYWLLTGKKGIRANRGYPTLTRDKQTKVIASWPLSTIQRNWSLRPILTLDTAKAERLSRSPAFIRPARTIYINPSISDIASFYETDIAPADELSCDIETKRGQITEVGYSIGKTRAFVIPFYSRTKPGGNYWSTLEEEREAWNWVRRINSEKKLYGQNFSYDVKYFFKVMGIPCPHFTDDTMLMHHALQPELDKGLGFLGSIYTDEPSWKFMRAESEHLKKES